LLLIRVHTTTQGSTRAGQVARGWYLTIIGRHLYKFVRASARRVLRLGSTIALLTGKKEKKRKIFQRSDKKITKY
jgi:hypothetical protein